jgi:transcriptional regulator with PAS, ATPase and Fis domain
MQFRQTAIPPEAILNTLMDLQTNSVLIVDLSGKIIMANDVFKVWLGKDLEELPNPLRSILTTSINIYPAQQYSKIFNMDGNKYVLNLKHIQTNGQGYGFIVYLHNVTSQEILESKLTQYIQLENILSRELNTFQRNEAMLKSIVYKNKDMEKIIEVISKIADFDTNVLLLGETGVGKSLIARTIHQSSKRAKYPLIEVNCGSIAESLLESELFGFLPGSFTGADKKGKRGLIECAEGGTLFLDEIAELPMHLQVKILDVIQNRRIKKIGSNEFIPVNIRLITATNKDLQQLVCSGNFREDLYYRINVMPIRIPPLRDRKEDIPELLIRILDNLGAKYAQVKILSPRAKKMLLMYDWPGNVRELENVLERAFITSPGKIIRREDLPEFLSAEPTMQSPHLEDRVIIKSPLPLKLAREILEKKLFEIAYEQTKSTVEVGQILGVDQSTASRKIRKHLGQKEQESSFK